ncbi:MAG: hypothetical protein UY76_C0043G0007 [Candidatus Uhrbacteria bacterium GW2011_GWA2_52_8d]|uniref:Uncharacterized protein n=1 Tax=Candidatus Uhrbacteria bacterium GW2011_GWA2_52_8d TaxID=1618979 RepID=A0A0G1ZUR1_9BACT|nr:MAG: hypothetical protein UY76_C0043G0007 [Candidatus Uhrbacteria bacterium GW2011_GWA2_52_8d]
MHDYHFWEEVKDLLERLLIVVPLLLVTRATRDEYADRSPSFRDGTRRELLRFLFQTKQGSQDRFAQEMWGRLRDSPNVVWAPFRRRETD